MSLARAPARSHSQSVYRVHITQSLPMFTQQIFWSRLWARCHAKFCGNKVLKDITPSSRKEERQGHTSECWMMNRGSEQARWEGAGHPKGHVTGEGSLLGHSTIGPDVVGCLGWSWGHPHPSEAVKNPSVNDKEGSHWRLQRHNLSVGNTILSHFGLRHYVLEDFLSKCQEIGGWKKIHQYVECDRPEQSLYSSGSGS